MERFMELRSRIAAADPEAEMVVPCKFHPRCRPLSGSRCRFSHVSPDMRDEFFVLQELSRAATARERVEKAAHQSVMRNVFTEILKLPLTHTTCLAVSYSYNERVHGTEYVLPPLEFFDDVTTPGGPFEADAEEWIGFLMGLYPGLRVVAVRTAPVFLPSRTADMGHPVRNLFLLPFIRSF